MITFIYFDIGGVLIRDFSGTDKWVQLKREMGCKSEADIKCFDRVFLPLESDACRGKRTIDSVSAPIRQECGISVPERFPLLHRFVDRFEPNPHLAALLPSLKNYRMGLLTDMYPGMLDAIGARGILPHISWDVIVDSSKVGYRKPDREIFSIAGKCAGVTGANILLVENKPDNVKAAKSFGWDAFLYDPNDTAGSTQALARYLSM